MAQHFNNNCMQLHGYCVHPFLSFSVPVHYLGWLGRRVKSLWEWSLSFIPQRWRQHSDTPGAVEINLSAMKSMHIVYFFCYSARKESLTSCSHSPLTSHIPKSSSL